LRRFWVYRTTEVDAAVNLCRKALKAKEDDDDARRVALESQTELKKGEAMLADAAQHAAKQRDAKSLREKDAVTDRLIKLAEENEGKVRDAAFKKVEYRMLVKAAGKTVRALDSGLYGERVKDWGPEEVAGVEGEGGGDGGGEEGGEGEAVAEGEEPTSRLETETNTPPEAAPENPEATPEPPAEEAPPAEEEPAAEEKEEQQPPSAPPSQPPSRPGTAPKTPATPVDKMAPHPPIDWHGSGQNLVDHIIELAAAVLSKEKEEDDAATAIIEAEAAKKKAHDKEQKKKGRKGRGDKADRKAKRKHHREEVHGVRIEEKIKEDTVGTGGTDVRASERKAHTGAPPLTPAQVLASSSKFKLSLAVGNELKLGFSIAGKGDYTVNTTVPRGKWVHISYVAFKPPKKRVACYMDGRLIGYEDGVKCYLPMQRIGALSHTLQGFVQEVRYWAVQRTKEEIKQYVARAAGAKRARKRRRDCASGAERTSRRGTRSDVCGNASASRASAEEWEDPAARTPLGPRRSDPARTPPLGPHRSDPAARTPPLGPRRSDPAARTPPL
jgi:hypothetical protein